MLFKKVVVSLILTLLIVLPAVSSAKSPVFKVSKGQDYVYIGGTIHLLSTNDYPLPQGFEDAFNDAQQVFFETDGAELQLPQTQAKMASIITFQDGRTLETVLDKKTYALLTDALTQRKLPISVFSSFTPAGISLTLTVFELQRLGLGNAASGVDQFFLSKTNQDTSKQTGFLETVDQQIGFISKLNEVDPNLIIKSSLEDLSALKQSWKLGLEAWRNGDLAKMSIALGADTMQTDFPSVYKTLLTDRNQHWISQIKPMFETPEVEYLLVGAMHLIGDDGVIELLRDQGYKIEQLD